MWQRSPQASVGTFGRSSSRRAEEGSFGGSAEATGASSDDAGMRANKAAPEGRHNRSDSPVASVVFSRLIEDVRL